jgi:protein-disulfide isomerase
MVHSRRPILLLAWVAVFALFACTPPAATRPAPAPTQAAPPASASPIVVEETPSQADPGTIVPVTANEPAVGDPLAPVTWVLFGDYAEPFSAKLFQRLEDYVSEIGTKHLRIVWRHAPMSSHQKDPHRLLFVAAETVFRLGGHKAFWAFSQRLFAYQGAVDGRSLLRWAAEVGVDPEKFASALAAGTFAAKVDEDIALAKKLNLPGIPASYINGVLVSGNQTHDKFVSVIAAQAAQAKALLASGVERERIYAAAVEKNYKAQPPPYHQPADTLTAWKVPLGKSPARGKPTALVTVVMFGDFECLFCAKVQPVVEQLEQAYGDKLRFVFKHEPLPFHPRAEPAAQLAIEAREQGGDAKFWEAYKLLYANHEHLSDQDLAAYAKSLGLKEKPAADALAHHKHAAVLDADGELAADLEAYATPTFFINGRRLLGAQPIESFKAIIDDEMASAQKLVSAGTPPQKVYDTLQKDAQAPDPPARIILPAPPAASPGKGAAAGAKVVVQMFADFQCPFSKKVQPVMDDLIAAFPGKVRVVYRHLPLPMHPQAEIAAEASVEALAQKGEAGFWAFAKLLWEDQSEAALGKEGLIAKAKAAGLDADKMRAALDSGAHRAAVKADSDAAAQAKITGTPSFAVNDYYVGGAQFLIAFKRAVKLALGPHVTPTPESLLGAPPKKASLPAPTSPLPEGTLFGAKHLLVMYRGSTRAPEGLTRTRRQAQILAQSIRKKLKQGAKFEDLVKEFSDEPGAAARGGDLGQFPRGRMVDEFQAALEGTAVNEISEVVETTFGFHVILRTK